MKKKSILIILISIIIILFLLSIGDGKITGEATKDLNENTKQIYITSQEQQVSYELKPNNDITLKVKEGDQFNMRVITNSQGLRETKEIPFEKPEGTYRILGLGDSIVFGSSVNNDETFLKIIEKEAIKNNKKVETINFGIPGSGPRQEYFFLKYKEGLKYSPDLVLLVLGATDFDNRIRKFDEETGNWSFEGEFSLGEDKKVNKKEIEETERWIHNIKNLLEENNIKLIVMLAPSRKDLTSTEKKGVMATGTYEGKERKGVLTRVDHRTIKLLEIIQNQEISNIDLFPLLYTVYIEDREPLEKIFWDNDHPNKFSHEIIGKAMYDALVEYGAI
jgi:hypothetical protein